MLRKFVLNWAYALLSGD